MATITTNKNFTPIFLKLEKLRKTAPLKPFEVAALDEAENEAKNLLKLIHEIRQNNMANHV